MRRRSRREEVTREGKINITEEGGGGKSYERG